ncbi:tetratricopeptide repeat protein [Fluctibacter corallii]|uniref:tetratricopeptide repeat protein n=1 Tax=Fluctibacter corallii TaxID=2984329 RepID=UPI0021E90DCB|nr:hypothetical protein [Aestuariibacter sp. AA17]
MNIVNQPSAFELGSGYFKHELFEKSRVIQPQDVLALTEEQQAHFLSYFHSLGQSQVPEHKRIANYLDSLLDGFNYHQSTYISADALTLGQGNCMSLALLTKSLAEMVSIDMEFEKVNSLPVYDRKQRITEVSSHVRTRLFQQPNDTTKKVVIRRPSVIIDYFPRQGNVRGDKVSSEEVFAMFYQNIAAEALEKGDMEKAFWSLWAAFKLAPENVETFNALAVFYRINDLTEYAENTYKYALNDLGGSASTVSNYAFLLSLQKRYVERDNLLESAEFIDDDNPYQWLDLAEKQLISGKFRLAERYYQKAVENGPYLHETYLGLAKSYVKQERYAAARKALKKAMSLSYLPKERRVYEGKLKALTQMQSTH